MAQASHLRPGNIVVFRGDLHSIYRAEHRTPGKGRAFVQIKMRNLRSGAMIDQRFSSTEDVERAVLEQQTMEYLYADGAAHYFMNAEDYNQIHLEQDFLGDAVNYLIPQLQVTVEFHEGKPIAVELPPAVDLEVVETEPGLKWSDGIQRHQAREA